MLPKAEGNVKLRHNRMANEAKTCPHDPTGRPALPCLWTAHTTPEQLAAVACQGAGVGAVHGLASPSLPTMFQEAEAERPRRRSEPPPPVTRGTGHQPHRTRVKRCGSALARPSTHPSKETRRPGHAEGGALPWWTIGA